MTGGAVQVVRYERTDRQQVHEFLKAIQPARDSDLLIRQWHWKYDDNPFNTESRPYIVVLKEDGRIIGLMADLPARVWVRGRISDWVCSCDLVVDAEYRGRGLSRLIIRQHMADHLMVFAWMNIASKRAAAPLTGSLSVPIRPLVRLLDLGRVVQGLGGRASLAASGRVLTRVTRTLVRFPAPASVAGVTISALATVDDRFDAFWRRASAEGPVMIVRDRAYLDWRFLRRPDATYTILVAARGGDVLGYLVLRRAVRYGMPWGYLVDFLVERESPSIWAMLVREAIARFREDGVALVGCLANRPSYRRSLLRLGFFPWRWGPQGYFHARVDAPDQSLHVARDTQQWLVTMGDGDVEMSF